MFASAMRTVERQEALVCDDPETLRLLLEPRDVREMAWVS